MDRHLLKLEPPYSIIYADGMIGRHIANIICTDYIQVNDPDAEGIYAETYPVLDCGGLTPAGSVAAGSIVEDCRVILPGKEVEREGGPILSLYQFARLVEFDSQQSLPLEHWNLFERLAGLGVRIVPDTEKNEHGVEYERMEYEISLSMSGNHEHLSVKSNVYEGFYFYADGTSEECFRQLESQRHAYVAIFDEQRLFGLKFHFQSSDMTCLSVVARLNGEELDPKLKMFD